MGQPIANTAEPLAAQFIADRQLECHGMTGLALDLEALERLQ